MNFIFAFFGLTFLLTFFAVNSSNSSTPVPKNQDISIYNFNVKTIDGKEESLSDYKGKVLLIVNVASNCGFTPQYKGLQELYSKYKDKGFEILGFPCNQFGHQEPGTNEEIKNFCSTNYGVTFPIFDKIEVNGDSASPLYKYLKSAKPGFLNENIKWNFTKFLIDRQGNVVDRFASQTTPESIEGVIVKLIDNK
jgi:glutathione peroxidase